MSGVLFGSKQLDSSIEKTLNNAGEYYVAAATTGRDQTKQLNEAAKTHTNVKFYSVTVDTPFAQERFCTANEINGLKAVSDFKYHQFGIQNGFLIKEKGLLTRALMIVDENNNVKYIEYVSEEGKEADVDKALKFLENKLLKK